MCFPTSNSQPRGVPSSLTTTVSLVLNPFPTSFRPARLGYNVSPAASFPSSTSRIKHKRYHNALTTTGSSVREKEEKRQSVRSEDRARPEARARTELVTDAAADGISNVVVGSSSPLQNTPEASHRRQQPSHKVSRRLTPISIRQFTVILREEGEKNGNRPTAALKRRRCARNLQQQANQHSSQWTHTRTRIHTQRYLVTFAGDRRSQIWSGSEETNGWTSAEFSSIHPPPSAQPYI